MSKRVLILFAILSLLINGMVACTGEIQQPSIPSPTEPVSRTEATTKDDLVNALEELRGAMLTKIDHDVEGTALTFTLVKDYWRTKRWADIFGASLTAVESTIHLLDTASTLKDLSKQTDKALAEAQAPYEILTTLLVVQGIQEAGAKLEYGLQGPRYISAIETMLEAADATTAPPAGFSKEHYQRVIENYLLGVQGEPVVKVARRSTDADREVVEFVDGASRVKVNIKRTFDQLIADIEASQVPDGFPTGEVVKNLKYLEQKVKRSTLHGVEIVYPTQFSEDFRTTLGAVSARKEAWRMASGNLAKKLDIEYEIELQKSGSAILTVFTWAFPGVGVLKFFQQAITLSELMISSYERNFHIDPEEAFYTLPQEMVLALPMELSNLWMIADDTDEYVRHLLETPPPIPGPSPTDVGAVAYVAAKDNLWTLDVSDPADMRTIGSGSTTHGAVDIFVQGNLAYVGGRYGNLRVLDVSNPSEPSELGHSDIPKGVLDVYATESYAFVTDSGGFLHVIDVSAPTTPLEVGRCGLSGGHTVQARGSLVYVATGWGLSVIDVSDPSAPVVMGEWGYDSSSIWVFDVEVSGDLAYGVANDRLWVIDVSEPTSPNKVGELSLPYAWEGVPTIDVCGTYAYIAMTGENRQPILRVIDVSLPTDPYQVGTSPLVGQPKDIHVVGSHAYVAAGTAGLGLINVSDPFNPHQIGYWDEIPALSSALAVFVTGSERQLPSEAPTPTQTPIPTQTPRAQAPASGGVAVQWSTTFGGSDNDEGHSVQQTSDGGYIIAGTTGSQGQGGRDVLLLKTDVRGNKVWERTFGSAGDEEGASVVQAADGGYVLAGFAGDESGGGDVWLIKTDANGNRIWDRKLGTSRYEERGRCVRQTSDGGYIIAGSAGQGREGPDEPLNIDALLIKTDPEGNEEWSRTFGDASWDDGNSVRQTSDGGYILVGQLWPFPRDHDYDAWVLKTDANGNEMWRRAFGTPEHSEFASAVEETSDGGYVIAGGTEIGAGEDSDVWLIRTDVNGNKVWNRTFGGAGYDVGTSVQQTSDGGYIIVGFILGADKGDVWLIKTDATGSKVWDRTFGDAGFDFGASVQQTSDGGYVLVGFTESYGAGGRDVWLIKVGN